MKEIWIFGDSFAEPSKNLDSWTKLLKKNNKFLIRNFALSGTGPDYQLKIFKKLMQESNIEDTKKIVVIFFVSDITRFNFKFLKPKDQVIRFEDSWKNQNKLSKSLYKKYVRYKRFIKCFYNFYVFHSAYMETELEKILGFLYLHSYRFEKTLAWPIFNDSSDFLPMKSSNFYVPNKIMSELNKDMYPMGQSPNINHLTIENNHILATELENWIVTGKIIDCNQFKDR